MAQLTSNLPKMDMSTSTTGCCPMFKTEDWDDKIFEFNDKPFIQDHTVSIMYVPLNMGAVMKRISQKADNSAAAAEDFILLSQDVSPWRANHYYAVKSDFAGDDVVRMSGKYYAKVFEGPYSQAGMWHKDLQAALDKRGYKPKNIYFYYTTCPKCAKTYGKNYVVGLAEV
jgi:hypothetical protein